MNKSIAYSILCIAFCASAQDGPSKKIAEMSIEELMKVKVSPFEVSTNKDQGYLASNSISGSRINTPIGDLPFALQAFTQSFIEDQKPVNIFDVAKYSPGVTYRSNDFNEGNANLAIRGFVVSTSPSSGQILRDGFRGPSIFDMTNISRIEVMKGPASFLYGQLSPGGVVNIITKTPQEKFAANAAIRYGSYDSYRLQTDVTGPATEKLLYRLAASYDQDIKYWDEYDAHSTNVSPSFLWKASNKLNVTFKYENFRKRENAQIMQKPGYNTQAGVAPSPSDPNRAGVDVPGLGPKFNSMSNRDFRYSDTNSYNTVIDYKLDDQWNLRAGHSRDDYRIDALFSGNFGMANNTTRLQGRRFRRTIYSNRGDTLQAEAVGKLKLDKVSLQLLLGTQFISRRFETFAGQAPNDPALGNDPVATPLPWWDLSDPSTWNRHVGIPLSALTDARSDFAIVSRDKSAYIGTTWGLFDDRLLILAGVRRTDTESKRKDYLTNVGDPKISASRNTPQYGAIYKLTSDLSVFASYSESFVPAGQPLQVRSIPAGPAKPTIGKGYDIGFKASLLDDKISGTLTYFEIDNKNVLSDITELDPVSGQQVFTTVENGEQRSRGVELDATFAPDDNWQLYFSYSYMDAKIVEFSGRDKAILSQDPNTLNSAESLNYKNVRRFHNAPLGMSARQLANLWTKYNFTDRSLKGFFVGGGANFVKDQTILPDTPRSEWQNYILINAVAGYKWKWHGNDMTLDFMGKNISNQYYRPSQSSRGRPKEFLLSLRIDL